MGFEFSKYLTPWVVGGAILLTTVGVSRNVWEDLLQGTVIDGVQTINLAVNTLIFVLFLSIMLVPSIRDNINKMINKIFEYPMKVIENFFKV
ncbi:MAG: hypothetical protein JW791_02675 [Nanoarchaeota archaeon]|nr:hypothetical protein [Nanoarchaeota archaeon]